MTLTRTDLELISKMPNRVGHARFIHQSSVSMLIQVSLQQEETISQPPTIPLCLLVPVHGPLRVLPRNQPYNLTFLSKCASYLRSAVGHAHWLTRLGYLRVTA